jgi:PIN domain nuclease of toxin-antitoxin system
MKRTFEATPLVLDTHIWIWLEAGSNELSAPACAAISRALGAGLRRVAAISLWAA